MWRRFRYELFEMKNKNGDRSQLLRAEKSFSPTLPWKWLACLLDVHLLAMKINMPQVERTIVLTLIPERKFLDQHNIIHRQVPSVIAQ